MQALMAQNSRGKSSIKENVWYENVSKFSFDEEVFSAHRQLLEASRFRKMKLPVSCSDEDIDYLFGASECKVISIFRDKRFVRVIIAKPDYSMRAKALAMIFKIKVLYRHSNASQAQYNELATS